VAGAWTGGRTMPMTSRERFLETMRYGTPDRVPCFEEGLRDGVLERWREQGLPEGTDVGQVFHYDRRERIELDLGFRPALKKWPTSRRGLRALRRRLDPDDPARFPKDWATRVAGWRGRDHVLELPLHSGFFLSMGVGDWPRLRELIYQLSDQRALVREMMEIRGEFVAHMARRVLSEVEIDFASFSEPIGGNDGPLLSPSVYEEVVLSTYRPALEVLRRHGVEVICYITYANARVLLPAVLNAGFNCLWACEAKPLLADGGYIPLADGRVRENVPFERYAYYRRLLERVVQVGEGGRGCAHASAS